MLNIGKLTEYNTASVQEKNYIFKDAVMVLIAWIFKVSCCIKLSNIHILVNHGKLIFVTSMMRFLASAVSDIS